MTIGRPLFAKLFLEGIEVPFIGASVTCTINQASIAYIDLVPHEYINEIKPRTLVHLFVRDLNDPTGKHPYVLAFQGEVFGVNFSKTPSSRNFSISCIDFTSYWDNVIAYFFNPMQSLAKGADGMLIEGQNQEIAKKAADGKVVVTHSEANYYSTIMHKAKDAAAKAGKAYDLFDGLVAIVKEISSVNDFYSAAESRLRISERIASASSGDITDKLIKQEEAMEWMAEIANRHSGFSTLRMVVNDLLSLIFHDFCSVAFPSLVEQPSLTKSLTNNKVPTTIGEFIFKPNMYMLPPPACNIFFPDEYSSFTYSRNFLTEPTRLVYKPTLPYIRGINTISLPIVTEPEALHHFMVGKGPMPDEYKGDGDVQVDTDYGHFGDTNPNVADKNKDPSNGLKKEHYFLTNEEKYKGILLAQEGMVPASSAFRQAYDNLDPKFPNKIAKYLFYKKRFEPRQIQITSHLKMSVVPGFTVLILDDSDADQNIIAYCSSITHRIYCNQGGYTNTTLSYARTVKEQDVASGKAGEPLIPPWFAKDIFGAKVDKPTASKDTDVNKTVQDAGAQIETPKDALSTYFSKLIGSEGNKCVTDLVGEKTLRGASAKLIKNYRANKKKGGLAVANMIDKLTHRRYIKMAEAFKFLDATQKGAGKEGQNFLEFYGDRLFGGQSTFDSKQLKARRNVIMKYRNALKNSRGFRG